MAGESPTCQPPATHNCLEFLRFKQLFGVVKGGGWSNTVQRFSSQFFFVSHRKPGLRVRLLHRVGKGGGGSERTKCGVCCIFPPSLFSHPLRGERHDCHTVCSLPFYYSRITEQEARSPFSLLGPAFSLVSSHAVRLISYRSILIRSTHSPLIL